MAEWPISGSERTVLTGFSVRIAVCGVRVRAVARVACPFPGRASICIRDDADLGRSLGLLGVVSCVLTLKFERAERAEAEMFHHLISRAPAQVKSRFGIGATRLGGRVVTSVRHDVTGYWSNAFGFGLDEPVTAAAVGEVIDFFASEGNKGALLHVAPALLPEDWAAIRDRYALRLSGARYQHICSVNDFRASASTDLRVNRTESAAEWTRFVMQGFGMPEHDYSDILGLGYGSDRMQLFGAWDGDQMVAAAGQFIWEDVAVLNSGVTLSSHRGRGAQSALIASRAAAAADAGCRWLVTQTGKVDPGTTNPSTNNVTRAGFTTLYARPAWAWGRPEHVDA